MITIIDYGMGNLGSIQNIIKKIGHQSQISSDLDTIAKANRIILPGVGNFDSAMNNLKNLNLIEVLKAKANGGTPLLGICLGMQLLANSSEEGVEEGLGLIPGRVKKFNLQSPYKIPHMGWNNVNYTKNCILYKDFDRYEETRFYFVHSYYFECTNPDNIAGTTLYSEPFTSSIYSNTIFGAQFHPEKSHKYGMLLLKNFIELI
ncbi:MAG: imidazole glycerol phosphate synthase subunit HisH [Bacteroidota bacterium]